MDWLPQQLLVFVLLNLAFELDLSRIVIEAIFSPGISKDPGFEKDCALEGAEDVHGWQIGRWVSRGPSKPQLHHALYWLRKTQDLIPLDD